MLAIEREEYGSLPKGPEQIQKAINENLDYCHLIDTDNIDIKTLPVKTEEEDDDYCIDLSFTALENYNNCPFRYKLANQIGFTISEKQEIDEGIFVHKALEIINKEIINRRCLCKPLLHSCALHRNKNGLNPSYQELLFKLIEIVAADYPVGYHCNLYSGGISLRSEEAHV